MNTNIRHDWSINETTALFDLPFIKLLHQALSIHLQNFSADTIQISSLLNIKTGSCPEDCSYCAQSSHHKTGIQKHDLLSTEQVVVAAKIAKSNGATRFCMGAAWRTPPEKQFAEILNMVEKVKELGLETCMTLGMLNDAQVQALKKAGLDYYNHNLDTSEEYYPKITTTRTYAERIATLEKLRKAEIKICSGGIIGLGESKKDRVNLLQQLANFPIHPHSVSINRLIPMKNTPLANIDPVDSFDFVRVIAVARILMPHSFIRLAAGRETMNDELQTLCFAAGVNSIFCGEKLLTSYLREVKKDRELLQRLGITTGHDT
ncbi:MAG: biotin synthase BioB [bacterium]